MDASSRMEKNPERVEKCLMPFLRWLICQTDTQQTNHTHTAADSHTLTIPFHMSTRCGKEKIKFRTVCGTSESELRCALVGSMAAVYDNSNVYLTKSCRANFYFSFAIAPSTKFCGDRHSNRSTCIFLDIFYFFRAACSLFDVNGCVHIFNFSRWKYF